MIFLKFLHFASVDILSENIAWHHNSADCGLTVYLLHFVRLTSVSLAEGKTLYLYL